VPLILVIYSKDKSVMSALCFRLESGGSVLCNFSSRWRWVFSCMPRLPYPQSSRLWYPYM